MRTSILVAVTVLILPLVAVAQDAAPPLSWNQALANDAQAWAQSLAARGGLKHAEPHEGESLAVAFGAQPGSSALVRTWIDEGARYAYGPLTCGAGIGSIGHYTQMVWAETKAVGRGLASRVGRQVLVCRYAPAGNICGKRPYWSRLNT